MANTTAHRQLIKSPSRVDVPIRELRSSPDVRESDFAPADLLHCIRRRGWFGLSIAIPLSLALAFGIYLSQKPKYLASALLRLSSTEQSLVFDDDDPNADYEIFQATQRELVGSRYVMAAALKRDELDDVAVIKDNPGAIDWMMGNVAVETPENSEIMKISASAGSESDAVKVVNAVVDAYLDEIVNRKIEIQQKRLDDITNVLELKQNEAREKRGELRTLVEQLGSSDSEALSVIQQLQVQAIGSLRSQLIDVHQKAWSAEARLRVLQANSDPSADDTMTAADRELLLEPTEDEVETALEKDPIYTELVGDKLTAVRLLAEAQSAFKDKAPSVYGNMQDLIDKELEMRRKRVREQLAASAPRRHRQEERKSEFEKRQEINQLNADLEVYGAMESRIDQEIAKLEQDFGKVGNQSIDVEMMRSEIAQLDEVVGNIKKQSEELQVEINSRPRAEVLLRAEDARVSNKQQRLALAGFAGMFGFALPISLILILDLFSRKVNSARTLAASTGLPVIGTIPLIPNRVIRRFGDKPSRKSKYWQARLSESVKRISCRLVTQFSGADSQVVLVTSADRKEGKTTLATQLARSLADTGRSVLLVDLNLRSPAIHRIFGMECSPGVCDLLRGEADLNSLVQPTKTPNLEVLPAGVCCPSALQALGYENTVPFFRELRTMADFVIVDGCPVLTSSEIGFICRYVDEVVLIARRDVSRINDIQVASEFIRSSNQEINGVVVVEPDERRHVEQFDRHAIA